MTDAPDELTVFDDYAGSATPVTFEADDRPLGITDVELAVFEGEAVLFDVQASMVHLFNAVAGATWMCCDGETSVTAMIHELSDDGTVIVVPPPDP